MSEVYIASAASAAHFTLQMRRTAAAAWVMALALALAALIGLCRAQQDTVTHPGSLLREWRLDKSFFSRRDRVSVCVCVDEGGSTCFSILTHSFA
jgi:hypothetical protein